MIAKLNGWVWLGPMLSYSGTVVSQFPHSLSNLLLAVICIGLRAFSFNRPILSVCIFCVSTTLRSNISETEGDRGSVTMGSL